MEVVEAHVSCPVPTSCDGATEAGRADAGEHRRYMSPKFMRACLILGMSSEALDWWQRIHVQSETAMLCYFSAWLLHLAMALCLVLGAPASGPYAYAFRAPGGFVLFSGLVQLVAFWRLGHGAQSDHGPKLWVMWTFTIPCTLTISLLGYLCPPAAIPFQSSLQYTAVLSLMSFGLLLAAACDPAVPAPEPIKSVISIFPSVCIKTLRALDCYTDFSFLRVLGTQKAKGCWWFRTAGQCGVYTALQICAWTLTILDLTASTCLAVMTLRDSKANGTKRVLYIHVFSAFCEVGVITITFLNLLSKQRNKERASSDSNNENLAIVIASLATTLLTLSLTIMGAGSTLAGLKVVAARVSVTGGKLAQKRYSMAGQKVAPMDVPVSRKSATGSSTRPFIVESPVVCDASVSDQGPQKEEARIPSTFKDS